MRYLVDSNFFIEAHRKTYPLDVVTSFWDTVKKLAEEGVIYSIDKVKQELYLNNDELKAWCKDNLPDSFFHSSVEVVGQYSQVISWANTKREQYLQKAIEEFLDADEADAFIVARAMKDETTIVTHEVSAPRARNKIKIPDVCIQFGVNYVNTIEMLRLIKISF